MPGWRRLVAVAIALTALVPVAAPAKKAPRVVCDRGGRYELPGSTLAPAGAELVLAGSKAWIDGVCPPVTVTRTAQRRFTRVRARWTSCADVAGRVVLDAKIDTRNCAAMSARLRAPRARLRTTRQLRPIICEQFGQPAFPMVADRVFAKRGCGVEACHGAAKAGGLDLRPGAAYLSLVGAAATNPAAHAAGKVRVAPGDSSASFLLQKLRGTLAPGEGATMPLAGTPPSATELALIETWINAGAPATDAVDAVPCLPVADFVPATPLSPPPGGYQLVLDGPVLEPRREEEGCLWVPTPNAEDFLVSRWEFSLNPGTHHFSIMSHTNPGVPSVGVWRADDIACQSGGAFGSVVAGAPQAPYFEATLPAGVAGVLPGGRYLGLNAHYYNEYDVPIQVKVWINVWPYEGTPVHIARGITSLDTTFGIEVPPFTRQVRKGRFVNGGTTPMSIFGIAGHMHKRGIRFTAWLADGSKVYETFDWAHPGSRAFDPPYVLPPGGYIDYECEHDNGVDRPVRRSPDDGTPTTVRFGVSAEDEMCILNGSYYAD